MDQKTIAGSGGASGVLEGISNIRMPCRPVRIAFLGLRGVPARYAGFETVVEELGSRLARRNFEVTVYNRNHCYPRKSPSYLGMNLVHLPALRNKFLETISHTVLATRHALRQKYDIVYICGVGNAWMARSLAAAGCRIVINVDGIDFKRAKWKAPAKRWLRRSEQEAITFAHRLVADNLQVVEHYRREYGFNPVFISYGAKTDVPRARALELERWNLERKKYVLYVGRLSPENEVHLLLEAYRNSGIDIPLVIVGAEGYEKAYFRKLKRLAAANVIFTGGIYGEGYVELSQNCLFFVLPAAIEATRLSLVDQMGFGSAILFRECPATREVVAETAEAFDSGQGMDSLRNKLRSLANDPQKCAFLGEAVRKRALACFSWEGVADQYEKLFHGMLGDGVSIQADMAEKCV